MISDAMENYVLFPSCNRVTTFPFLAKNVFEMTLPCNLQNVLHAFILKLLFEISASCWWFNSNATNQVLY